MKKHGVLHRELAALIASLGHGDAIVVADSGLPVPPGVACIDLAVSQGVPPFLPVLQTILFELVVERAVMAQEVQNNETLLQAVVSRLNPVNVQLLPHDQLKELSKKARAIIRTGEWTPYANVILYAGVPF